MSLPPRSFLEPRTLSRSCYDLSESQSAHPNSWRQGQEGWPYIRPVSLNSISQPAQGVPGCQGHMGEQGEALEKDPPSLG